MSYVKMYSLMLMQAPGPSTAVLVYEARILLSKRIALLLVCLVAEYAVCLLMKHCATSD